MKFRVYVMTCRTVMSAWAIATSPIATPPAIDTTLATITTRKSGCLPNSAARLNVNGTISIPRTIRPSNTFSGIPATVIRYSATNDNEASVAFRRVSRIRNHMVTHWQRQNDRERGRECRRRFDDDLPLTARQALGFAYERLPAPENAT